MKLCKACNTEKCSDQFHKRKASTDGLAAKCKCCQKDYDKSRLRDPRRMQARIDYQKTEKGKLAHSKAASTWRDSNKKKRSCHVIVGNALRSGILSKSNCEACNSKDSHGHHDDYNKPMVVRWLCPIHHKEWHSENGEGLNSN